MCSLACKRKALNIIACTVNGLVKVDWVLNVLLNGLMREAASTGTVLLPTDVDLACVAWSHWRSYITNF